MSDITDTIINTWKKVAQSLWSAQEDARKAMFGDRWLHMWGWKCPHGFTISTSAECPACAAQTILRQEAKIAAYKKAIKLSRTIVARIPKRPVTPE